MVTGSGAAVAGAAVAGAEVAGAEVAGAEVAGTVVALVPPQALKIKEEIINRAIVMVILLLFIFSSFLSYG
jgi:hypothetical protein